MTNLENQYLKEDREAFESYFNLHYNGSDPCFQIAESGGDYVYRSVQESWEVWQAAKSQYLSERNECVEEIRRLRDCLENYTNAIGQDPRYSGSNSHEFDTGQWARETLANTSPTIERLLKESKNV